MTELLHDNPGLFFSNLRAESSKRLRAAKDSTRRDRALLLVTTQIAQVGAMAARVGTPLGRAVLARSVARFETLLGLAEYPGDEVLIGVEELRLASGRDYLRLNNQPVE